MRNPRRQQEFDGGNQILSCSNQIPYDGGATLDDGGTIDANGTFMTAAEPGMGNCRNWRNMATDASVQLELVPVWTGLPRLLDHAYAR